MPFDKGRFGLRGAGKMLMGFAVLVAVFPCSGVGTSAEESAPPAKIAMRIFYAGHPGSLREKDFVEFLGQHFTQVQTGDLATFNGKSADGSDVAILDYDGDGMEAFKFPRPRLSQNYAHATVTVGVAGALIGNELRLKTGYE